jgi:hypothetical protein
MGHIAARGAANPSDVLAAGRWKEAIVALRGLGAISASACFTAAAIGSTIGAGMRAHPVRESRKGRAGEDHSLDAST